MEEAISVGHSFAQAHRRLRLGFQSLFYEKRGYDSCRNNRPNEKEAHQLIEEIMIMANYYVAKYLLEKFPDTTPLRVQPPPKDNEEMEWNERFQQIMGVFSTQEDFLQTHNLDEEETGFTVPCKAWNSLIQQRDKERASFQELTRILCDLDHFPHLALASMRRRKIQQKSSYICSGENFDYIPYPWPNASDLSSGTPDAISVNDARQQETLQKILFGHHDLSLDSYCHFTSPIRRYIDVIAHRLVIAALESRNAVINFDHLTEICEHCTYVQRNSNKFEKHTKKLQLAIDLKTCSGKFFVAYVDKMTLENLNVFFGSDIADLLPNYSISDSHLGLDTDPEKVEIKNSIKLQWKLRLIHFDNRSQPRLNDEDIEVSKDLLNKLKYQSQG